MDKAVMRCSGPGIPTTSLSSSIWRACGGVGLAHVAMGDPARQSWSPMRITGLSEVIGSLENKADLATRAPGAAPTSTS